MSFSAYFARHAQVLVGSLGRIVHQPFATLMTMGVIAVALALPLFLSLLLQNARIATGNWNEAYDLSVYMDKRASAARVQSLAKQLKLRGDVAAVHIITADQALVEFRNEWVKRLRAILDLLRRVVLLTGVLLGVGIVLIVSNTIRLDILNRRAEIEVMKLVGASDGFARRPFLYSGFWYGLGGGLLALILVAIASVVLARPVAQLAFLYGSEFRLQGLNLMTGFGVLMIAAGLSWIGSWLAATRHIRAIEPS
jgi:cell division transport system permease protein